MKQIRSRVYTNEVGFYRRIQENSFFDQIWIQNCRPSMCALLIGHSTTAPRQHLTYRRPTVGLIVVTLKVTVFSHFITLASTEISQQQINIKF